MKEVIGAFDPYQVLGFRDGCEDLLHDGAWAVLVVISADEEFGLSAVGQELVGVVAAFGVYGEAEADESFDAGVSAGGAQANVGAEGEAGEEDWPAEVAVKPVEGGAGVLLLAVCVVECAFAEADASEVEAEHGNAEGGERLHGVIDDLVVHGAASHGVGVADECGVGSVFAAGVEQGFEFAGGAVEVID